MLDLPAPDRSRLPRSPLELVVCQVRYDQRLAVSDPQMGLKLHEALGGRAGPYRHLSRAEGHTLNVDVSRGAPTVAQQTLPPGWRLGSADGHWNVSLMPDHVSLETTAYTTWEEFRDRLYMIFDAVGEHVEPDLEHRIGLRYIDRIRELGIRAPGELAQYLAPELLGLVLHEALGEAVTSQQQQIALSVGDEAGCRFAHGFLRADEGDLHYVLDYDLFREGVRAFDGEGIKAMLEEFHIDALKLFQASVTPNLVAAMRED